MANVFKLDNIIAEVEKENPPVEIDLGTETVVLRNVMRLLETERAELKGLLKDLTPAEEGEEKDDLVVRIGRIFKVVAADGKGQLLIDTLGDDLGLVLKVFHLWEGAEDVGEASNSPE